MALESSFSSGTEGPFEQFDDCISPPCQFRNTVDGKCTFETCLYLNELPAASITVAFECQICKKTEFRDPKDMRIMVCDSCLTRMHTAEVTPFTCVFCGKSQGSPSKIFLSAICDHCIVNLTRSINCTNCGNTPA